MSRDLPLAGKRVLVTRSRQQAGQLSRELATLGAEAIEIPAIEVLPPEDFHALDEALRNLRRYDWLIVTSANAVRAIEARRAELKVAAKELDHLKVAAVGASTARAVEKTGLRVSVIPEEYVAESLAEALVHTNGHYLIARAAAARDVIPNALRVRGAEVDVVDAYRTVVPRSSVKRIAEIFAGERPDAATFTSSSSVTNFFHLLREAGFERQPEGLRAVSIGPVTSATLRGFEWEPAAEADPHDVAGLVAATVRALRQLS